MPENALTPEQRAALQRPAPWAWCVVLPDGFMACYIDHAQARKAAEKSHGIVEPMGPMPRPIGISNF